MRLFALKEILEKETDDKHSITMERILQLLQTQYDMKAERKSIYDDMRAFREAEILEVTPPQGKERGYSERRELTGSNGAPLQMGEVKIYIPDNGRDKNGD
jgi:hypothetical protein